MKSIYLEMLPLSGITKHSKGKPKDGVAFTGYPRVHPSDKSKLILLNDPLGMEQPVPPSNPNERSFQVLEFNLEDILFVEEQASAVTESGEGVPLVKLWIQRGAVGVKLEPFEVK